MIWKIMFFVSAFIIFWAMIGYPISIKILSKIYNNKTIEKNYGFLPTVTIMIVAHNEEKVIFEKLNNVIQLNYPKEKLKILVSSDNSTDGTNEIVEKFISKNKNFNIKLYKVKSRKGKTNAQNEAQKIVDTDFLVMTDANSILEKNSIKELVSSFTSDNIKYVTGRLLYVNNDTSGTSRAENNYWNNDLYIRDIESRIQTITAGNGALYACRNSDYFDTDLIRCHDTEMPLKYGLSGGKAICNPDAIVYEKASEIIEDEFKRKIRMNRGILRLILPDIRLLNIFKYKWLSYFYFGHRTCRYLLWISHLILIICNIIIMCESLFYITIFIGQILFYLLALIKIIKKSNNKFLNLIYYYCVTVAAQWVGVYNIIAGKAKPFWEKAESTR